MRNGQRAGKASEYRQTPPSVHCGRDTLTVTARNSLTLAGPPYDSIWKWEITVLASEPAGMSNDRRVEIRGPPVMQEKDALTDAPQRGGTEFAAIGVTLGDAVGQPAAHIMEREVAERRKAHIALVGDSSNWPVVCVMMWHSLTTDILENLLPAGRRGVWWSRSRRRREAHEGGKIDGVR